MLARHLFIVHLLRKATGSVDMGYQTSQFATAKVSQDQTIKMAKNPVIGRIGVICIALVIALQACDSLVDAVGCLDSVMNCFRPANDQDAPAEVASNFERDRSQSFDLIDLHLRNKVPTDDLLANLNEVLTLLYDEEDERSARFRFRRSRCLSQQLESKNREAMIDALLKLKDLSDIRFLGYECDDLTTTVMADVNYQTSDPIGRRSHGRPDLRPRVDQIVHQIAMARAENCLTAYKEHLTRFVINPPEGFTSIRDFWHRVLQRRMAKANYQTGSSVERAFVTQPKETYEFVSKLPYAIEEDDMDIVLELLDSQPYSFSRTMSSRSDGADLRAHKFNKFLVKPCTGYINVVRDVFTSFDFDMQLQQYLPEELIRATDHDDIVNELRAYQSMCMKLVNEKDRFVGFLNRLTLAELPFHETDHGTPE